MIPAVTATGDGALFRVKCRPGANATKAKGIHGDMLRIDVAAPPEDGRANEELLRWLARALEMPKAQLAISAGASSREKSIRVSGIHKDELERRLKAFLVSTGADP